MALLDDEELLPFFGNPNIQRQGARARALAAQRDVNTLPDPRTYAAVSGLLGQAPDEMGFSVLNPDYQGIQNVARPAYGLGLAAQLAPFLAPITKGLPVGASIKNVGKTDSITGLPLNSDGTVTLFHHTNKTAAEQIAKSGRLKSAGEPSVYLTTEKATTTGYGDVAVPVRVKPSLLNLDDEFPSGRMDFSIDTGKPKGSVPVTVEKQSPQAPQQAALDLAQQRAALPVEQGGLGLLGSNTAEQRAAAMGFTQNAYHGTPIFPSGLGDILKFNPNASVEMARRKPSLDTVGSWFSDNPASAGMYEGGGYGAIYPVKINPGNVKETTFENMNRTAMRLAGENPKTGEYAKPNAVQAYKDWLDANKINALSISHNPESPSTEFLNQVATVVRNPDDIRSRFAAFDPFRRSAAVAATMGAAAPDLLAAQQDEEMRKLQQLGLLGMVAP